MREGQKFNVADRFLKGAEGSMDGRISPISKRRLDWKHKKYIGNIVMRLETKNVDLKPEK